MHPKRCSELNGIRLAFVQGGPGGFRLVHVTQPIAIRNHGSVCEAKWRPAMPLAYANAPIVANNEGYTDIRLLRDATRRVRRHTPVSRFASGFRSRRQPLSNDVAAQVIATYKRFRARRSNVAKTYQEAMPTHPPRVERDRAERYG